MTVAEILEQAKALSLEERKELTKQLIDSFGASKNTEEKNESHWGKNLLKLLDEVGPIELIYPEVEDPVEWVKQIRDDDRRRRLGDWGDNA